MDRKLNYFEKKFNEKKNQKIRKSENPFKKRARKLKCKKKINLDFGTDLLPVDPFSRQDSF